MSTWRIPSPAHCFGREQVCAEIVRSATTDGSVLLYGGRQSGKTTVLLRIARDLADLRGSIARMVSLDVPVYVDLMKLPAEATPPDFFRVCASLASAACQKQVDGFCPPDLISNRSQPGLDAFEQDICKVIAACGQTQVRLVFLIDESKRILGERFPREFRDNLFYLLYGSQSLAGACCFVFSGAQELDAFLEEGTSPIGTRAARLWMENFSSVVPVEEMMRLQLPPGALETARRRAALIYDATGGHAGLSAALCTQFTEEVSNEDKHLVELMERYQTRHASLFQVFQGKLSREALAIHNLFFTEHAIAVDNIPRELNRLGLNTFRSEAAARELSYTGIVRHSGLVLEAANRLYFGWALRMVPSKSVVRPGPSFVDLPRPLWQPRQILSAMRPDGWSGLYVVGCFDHRITFYAQQTRALTLLRALIEDKDLRPGETLGIIGGGAAGATAAVAAAQLGHPVTLFEQASELIHLQAVSKTRLLHPHIYDYPRHGSTNPQAGLPLLDWSANIAEQVAMRLRTEVEDFARMHPHLEIKKKSRIQKIEPLQSHAGGKRLRLIGNEGEIVDEFHVALIAVGFGIEESPFPAVRTPSYWSGDPLDGPLPDGTKVLVSGYGDGGLTDLARATLREFRHDRAVEQLSADPAILELAKEMDRIDETARTARAQGREPHNLFHSYGKLAVPETIVKKIVTMARSETRVTFNYEHPSVFSLDSATINRLLAFLILKARLAKPKLGRVLDVVPSPKDPRLSQVQFSTSEKDDFEIVILRYGPPKNYFEKVFLGQPDLIKACQTLGGKLAELEITGTLEPSTHAFYVKH